MKLVIVDYGAGNVFSVKSAFERLGISPVLSRDADEIRSADRVLFPGVGHAETAMQQLRNFQLDELIPTLKQPVLGICLGMQLMCDFSEEGNTNGLGIFDQVNVVKFPETLKVPQIGWNDLHDTHGFLEGITEAMYFVHSYYAPLNPYAIAQTDYPFAYASAMEKNNFIGCQFHPEKSGKAGEEVLKRFLTKE